MRDGYDDDRNDARSAQAIATAQQHTRRPRTSQDDTHSGHAKQRTYALRAQLNDGRSTGHGDFAHRTKLSRFQADRSRSRPPAPPPSPARTPTTAVSSSVLLSSLSITPHQSQHHHHPSTTTPGPTPRPTILNHHHPGSRFLTTPSPVKVWGGGQEPGPAAHLLLGRSYFALQSQSRGVRPGRIVSPSRRCQRRSADRSPTCWADTGDPPRDRRSLVTGSSRAPAVGQITADGLTSPGPSVDTRTELDDPARRRGKQPYTIRRGSSITAAPVSASGPLCRRAAYAATC